MRNGDVYQYRIYNPAGFVRLWFDDWSLSPVSNITVSNICFDKESMVRS